MTKSNRPLKENDKLIITDSEVTADVIQKKDYLCKIKFSKSTEEVIDEYGSLPLPPYLNREPNEEDYARYQTVYAKEENNRSTAAPTAGLHFEDSLLNEIKDKGINIASITLDIGLGTFKPITVNDIYKHKMHSEYGEINKETADMVTRTLKAGGRVIPVGTTSLRILESLDCQNKKVKPFSGSTDIFIKPGYKFKKVFDTSALNADILILSSLYILSWRYVRCRMRPANMSFNSKASSCDNSSCWKRQTAIRRRTFSKWSSSTLVRSNCSLR